jgi:hypothetical protein
VQANVEQYQTFDVNLNNVQPLFNNVQSHQSTDHFDADLQGHNQYDILAPQVR